jgi:N-acetylglucosamine kinase-like BadF-type ATPase
MNKIYIGFDGGGTNSRFILQDGDGNIHEHILKECIKIAEIGLRTSAMRMAEYIKNFTQGINGEYAALAISLSGASNPENQEEYKTLLREYLGWEKIPIFIESDSIFALQAAYPAKNKSGLLLLVGTGSVIMAKTKEGEIAKIGGWGKVYGDEGSGHWIGIRALKHFCDIIDGIREADMLFVNTREFIGGLVGRDEQSIRNALYRNTINAADLAPIVIRLAQDDVTANTILREGAEMLSQRIRLLYNQIAQKCDPVLTFHGSVSEDDFYREIMIEKLKLNGFSYRTITHKNVLEHILSEALKLA